MDLAAAPDTCCEMMPLDKLSKGSILSASPSGEKTLQWFFSINGFSRTSTLMRCSHASCRSVCVVVRDAGALDGEMDSMSRDVTNRDVSGDSSVALVVLGSASRVTVALRAFVGPSAGSAIT